MPDDVEKRGIIEELYRGARKRFPRRKTYVKHLDDIWQIDLADLTSYARFNAGNKYILAVIDVLSKYAWAVPIRDKKGKTVSDALEKILEGNRNRVPVNIQTDDGKEFFNRVFQDLIKRYNINHYSTFSHMKAAVVERFFRSFKGWLFKEFSVQGNYKWLHLLPQLLKKYNSRIHRTTGMRPTDVARKHEKMLVKKLNKATIKRRKPKFAVNDIVRLSRYKTIFEKGYTGNWGTELFTIDRVRKTIPPVYHVRDQEGQIIKGAFYEQELQKTKYPDTYLVEKVLKRRGNKAFVKWYGFPSRFNTWL